MASKQPNPKALEIGGRLARYVFSKRGNRTEVHLSEKELAAVIAIGAERPCNVIEQVRQCLERHVDKHGDAEPFDVAGALLAVQTFQDSRGY